MSNSTRHTGETDKVHTIELPSAIEQVSWSRGVSSPGGEVGLGVFTQYVGNGAELQIELSDNAGKKIASLREKLAGHRSWLNIRIPKDAREALFADVKLPKHGLSKRSPALLLTPPVEIKNVKWSAQEARRGDVLTLTAELKGAPDGTEAEISIWEHDQDGAHIPVTRFSTLAENGRVELEWEYEYHDRTEDIPRDEEVEDGYHPPEYFFRVEVYGLSEDSELLEFKDWIEIRLIDNRGAPQSGREYELHLPDGSTRIGTLDDDGRAIEEDMPPGAYHVEFPQ